MLKFGKFLLSGPQNDAKNQHFKIGLIQCLENTRSFMHVKFTVKNLLLFLYSVILLIFQNMTFIEMFIKLKVVRDEKRMNTFKKGKEGDQHYINFEENLYLAWPLTLYL